VRFLGTGEDKVKRILKVLVWLLNLALVWVTMLAFIAVGYPLVGLVVVLVMTYAIGYVVAVELS
jgi:hypothetical protein